MHTLFLFLILLQFPHRVGSWPYLQILDQAGKARQGQTLTYLAFLSVTKTFFTTLTL